MVRRRCDRGAIHHLGANRLLPRLSGPVIYDRPFRGDAARRTPRMVATGLDPALLWLCERLLEGLPSRSGSQLGATCARCTGLLSRFVADHRAAGRFDGRELAPIRDRRRERPWTSIVAGDKPKPLPWHKAPRVF